MASDFLTGLANQIEDQFSIGENQAHTLDIVQDGHVQRYGKLGDFSQKFDQSAQRQYLETGYLRVDPFNVIPEQFETLLQEPDATVLVKKRAFSSLSENYRSDFMDQEEKLYFKATKLLFQNKCRQISAFEKLSKIARVSAAAGQLDDQLMPLIISLVDEASNNFSDFTSGITSPGDFSNFDAAANSSAASSFKTLSNVIDKIRKIYAFSPVNSYTTWVADNTNIFQTTFGQGTGVIELTNVTSFTTTTSTNFNGGSFNLQFSDPYGLMRITDFDIEAAISDATNYVSNKKIFQLGKDSLDKIASNNIKKLNDARAARGASSIDFIVNPDTFLGKRVRAIIENAGVEINFDYNPIPSLSSLVSNGGVTVSPESLRGGPEVGDEGLDDGKITPQNGIRPLISVNEINLFSDAVSAIFTSLDFTQSQTSTIARQSDFKDPSGKSTLDLNYVRRKLRFHYGNKLIVQPMDQVHIFIGSKSSIDNKILAGLQNMFTGLGFFQKLDTTVFDLKNQFNTLFNPSANIDLQLEKSIFLGDRDFPSGLWAMMRNMFINDKSGTHVFAGVVGESNQDVVPGRYTVSISGRDNTSFFDYGIINLNPGVDTFNGPLYDPLTPFKTRFDAVTTNFNNQQPEFLEENKAILGLQNSNLGLIRYKSGRHAGKPVTNDNFFQDKQITSDGNIRSVYNIPDGLVYKWKEGIGTFTYFADSFNATNPERIGIPAITEDPFAGQDIMNVLSLLITGLPYNYATYYKAVREFDNTGRNPQSGQNPAASFYNSITTTLKKNNLLWGSFIPFKNMVIDDQSFNKMIAGQANILNQNDIVNNQLSKIQDLQNKLFIASVNLNTSNQQQAILDGLKNQITAEKSSLNDELSRLTAWTQNTVPTSVIGNDVSFDPDQLNASAAKSLSDPTIRAELRRKTNFLTRRLSWAVRANEDKNLLIVDDSYDKDYDILAFEKALKGKIAQFSNQYTTVRDKITTVAGLLNLEVFCDTQGHIRIRPQQYNRMPSSVFYRMMQMKQINGIQIYPNFLEDLFIDQLNSLLKRMEILELQIRLDGAILGISNDDDLTKYLNGKGADSGQFQFFSNSNGDILDVQLLLNSSDPDTQLANVPTTFDSKLQSQNALTSVFTTVDRAKLITTILPTSVGTASITGDLINSLITAIFNKSGQQVTLDNFIVPQPSGVVVSGATNIVDVLKVTQELAEKISERQKLVKSISSAFKNAKEAMSLDTDPKKTGNKLLFPNLYGNKNVPEIFAHMIEDETYDDFGPGSGSRYIIHDYQIIRMNISEVPPSYTMIEVQGIMDPFLGRADLPPGFDGAFPGGGNSLVTAAAVDYDLWRMYGFRSMYTVQVPFLSNPDTQCAPYAVSLLSRARKEILQGTITIAGNEFMQPGEVVYIENRGLLFYVESVTHSFSYGNQSFTTSMNLKYGHNPGEYIPTSLDMIGKMLYNNRDSTSSINYRQTNIYNETSFGAIVINPSLSVDQSSSQVLTDGPYGEFNLKVVNDLLYGVAGIISANSTSSSNVNAAVELRIFYDSHVGVDQRLSAARDTLKDLLTGRLFTDNKSLNTKPNIVLDNVIADSTTNIDISSTLERRSPSQKATDMARNVLTTNPGSGGNFGPLLQTPNPLLNAISTFVIDCVVTFTNKGNS
jgi:hypothetical protein